MFLYKKVCNLCTDANTAVLLLCPVSPSPMLQDGETALMHAAKGGHLEVVKQLISSGAKVNATDLVSIRIMSEQLCLNNIILSI